eukprot:TRINITY_DN4536_c0_g2_i2.p1 TRINITY_DN4536_c0_g2~~TRINITY_DN4536_c0_g2_i2.p1  ORF type:complete len:373 (+),score=57.13 TRINITY_DN4536_c0_g2_i2:122-1120(+)
MTDLQIDINKMPLGKLTQERVKHGYEVLTKIETVLKENKDGKQFELLSLSNEFYTLIPTDFGRGKVPLIDSFTMLQQKMSQMEALMDIQIASSLISKERTLAQVHPTDSNYEQLGCEIHPLSKYSRDYKMILRYVQNSYSSEKLGCNLTVIDVFKINRAIENEKFSVSKELRPRKLLWHGSRLCNLVGILNQGLRIAPPEAPMSGYMFGKGIYFGDRTQKSAQYCFATPESNKGILLLSDVALGESYDLNRPFYVEKLPENKTSVRVIAKTLPDPSKDEIWDDKVVVPCGASIDSGEPDVFLEDQEYVVYNTNQIKLRYLIVVQFDFINKKA